MESQDFDQPPTRRRLNKASIPSMIDTRLTMTKNTFGDISWERMNRAVEKVRDRLTRAASALERANIPYAIVGGNAVAAWVSRVDEAAVRNTRDVDVLIRRSDLDAVKSVLADSGFVYRHDRGIDMFLDGAEAKARDAIHVVFAGEKIHPSDLVAAPDVQEVERVSGFRLIALDALVAMKLTSYRDKDRMHLRDLIDVGLIDVDRLDRLPVALAARLRELLDHPEE